jgi:hypothetical protein
MEEQQRQLFALMVMAEENQKAVSAALEGMQTERTHLAGVITHIATVADSVKQAADTAIPALQTAVGKAIMQCVAQSIAHISEEASQSMHNATAPVVEKLSSAVNATHAAEKQLKNASQWFAWKWVAIAAGGMMGVCLLAWMSVAWQRHQINELTEQKSLLQNDILTLQSAVAVLEKKGARIKLSRCSPENRLCVEIASNQGNEQENWQGSWRNSKTGQQFIIPKGY